MFLEPFLLPSLAAGLVWFAHRIWETSERSTDMETSLPALEALLKPPSSTSDSSAMHAAVLSIVAKPLEDALGYAQRQHPLRADISPLLDTLKPQAHKQRHEVAFHSELETWACTPGGGLLAALRHTIQSLLLWSSTSTTADSPPQYTHRQLVETLRMLGAQAVLQLLLDEAMAHFDTGSAPEVDMVLDIIVTMIAAPQPHLAFSTSQPAAPKRQLSLLDALTADVAGAFDLSKINLARATMTVRLHRRVQALLGRPGHGTAGAGADGGVLLHGVVHNADGMPTADIDDVLVEAEDQMAADFLTGGSAAFLGVR